MVLGLIGAVVLASGSLWKAVPMVLLGLLVGLVGTDTNSGLQRYTFGIPALADGVGFVPIAMGLLGITEIINNLEQTKGRVAIAAVIGRLMPTRAEFAARCRRCSAAPRSARSSASCRAAARCCPLSRPMRSRRRCRASPGGSARARSKAWPGRAANNAGAQTSFVPLLTLGLPSNPTMAVMVGAMTIQGISPGPRVMTQQPELFWGIIVSMWVGNLMLIITTCR